MLGGYRARLDRARPQQSGWGGPWCSPGNVLMDSECLQPLGVVLAAEHHRSGGRAPLRGSTPRFGSHPDPSSGEPTLVAENDGARPPEQLQRGRGRAESIGTYPGVTQGHPYPLCCGLARPKRPQEPPSIFGFF